MPVLSSALTPGFGWNELAGRYINLATGRFVSLRSVTGSLEEVIARAGANMLTISQQLQAGGLNLEEWRLAMKAQIKLVHTASGAAARGGWAQMSQSDWGFVGQQVKQQYKYLDKFAQEIMSGKQPLNGRFLRRSKMYAQAGRSTYESMRRRYLRNKGAVEERRVLDPRAEHCAAGARPGCVELANLEWQPVGTLPMIGEAQCLTFCRCTFEFRDASGKVM